MLYLSSAGPLGDKGIKSRNQLSVTRSLTEDEAIAGCSVR